MEKRTGNRVRSPEGDGLRNEKGPRLAPLRIRIRPEAPGREAIPDNLSGLPLPPILKGLLLGEAPPEGGGLRTEIDLGGRPLEQDLQEEPEG